MWKIIVRRWWKKGKNFFFYYKMYLDTRWRKENKRILTTNIAFAMNNFFYNHRITCEFRSSSLLHFVNMFQVYSHAKPIGMLWKKKIRNEEKKGGRYVKLKFTLHLISYSSPATEEARLRKLRYPSSSIHPLLF